MNISLKFVDNGICESWKELGFLKCTSNNTSDCPCLDCGQFCLQNCKIEKKENMRLAAYLKEILSEDIYIDLQDKFPELLKI